MCFLLQATSGNMCDVEELECSVKKFLEMERGTPAIYGFKKKRAIWTDAYAVSVSIWEFTCTCVYLCFLATFTKGKVLNNFSSSYDDQRIVIFKILEPDRYLYRSSRYRCVSVMFSSHSAHFTLGCLIHLLPVFHAFAFLFTVMDFIVLGLCISHSKGSLLFRACFPSSL